MLPGPFNKLGGLEEIIIKGRETNSCAPVSRWDTSEARGAFASAAYGAFVIHATFSSDFGALGISRTEAQGLEPVVALVLEASYGVLAVPVRSMTCRASLRNTPVGIYLGAGGSFSSKGEASPVPCASAPSAVYAGTSGALSVLSGRVSFTLGLTGPCLTADTACSSSLVATHLAASSMKLFECESSVATGVCVLAGLVTTAFSAAGMLSSLGRSHTFDYRADGYCRGEGCGAVLLRPAWNESTAHVMVSASAVQQDGPSASLTAPNGSSQ